MKKFFKFTLIALFAMVFQSTFSSCERIDAGHVGIKVNMTGDEKGVSNITQVTGWNFYIPGASEIYEFPVYTQTKDYEPFSVTAKGGSIFTVDPTLNYYVDANSVPKIFSQYRKDLSALEDGILGTIVRNSYRDVINSFTPDSVISNTALFESKIQENLIKEFRKEGFIFQQITSNIQPPKSLVNAINAKNNAVQNALTSENKVKVAEASAKIAAATAKGIADSLLITARAEAEANKLRQQSLTSLLIQQQWIEAWRSTGGNVPNVIGTSNTMYQLPSFK